VKDKQSRIWRSLLVARRTVLNEMRAIENVVRALLRETGIKLGTLSRKEFVNRTRELMANDPVLTGLTEPLLTILTTMVSAFARLTKQVLDIVRGEPVCRRLMSVPGVGPLTALAFRATIDQPERFARSRNVGAHLGLTPRRYQSGETGVQGAVNSEGCARQAEVRRSPHLDRGDPPRPVWRSGIPPHRSTGESQRGSRKGQTAWCEGGGYHQDRACWTNKHNC